MNCKNEKTFYNLSWKWLLILLCIFFYYCYRLKASVTLNEWTMKSLLKIFPTLDCHYKHQKNICSTAAIQFKSSEIALDVLRIKNLLFSVLFTSLHCKTKKKTIIKKFVDRNSVQNEKQDKNSFFFRLTKHTKNSM